MSFLFGINEGFKGFFKALAANNTKVIDSGIKQRNNPRIPGQPLCIQDPP